MKTILSRCMRHPRLTMASVLIADIAATVSTAGMSGRYRTCQFSAGASLCGLVCASSSAITGTAAGRPLRNSLVTRCSVTADVPADAREPLQGRAYPCLLPLQAGCLSISAYTSGSSTVLRDVHRMRPSDYRDVRQIGVDDWAWLKGVTYGSIIIDLENGWPIDLLGDRGDRELPQMDGAACGRAPRQP